MIHKQVFHLHMLIARLYGTLAPVVLFPIPLFETLFIKQTNLIQCFFTYAHAKADARWKRRIYRL